MTYSFSFKNDFVSHQNSLFFISSFGSKVLLYPRLAGKGQHIFISPHHTNSDAAAFCRDMKHQIRKVSDLMQPHDQIKAFLSLYYLRRDDNKLQLEHVSCLKKEPINVPN